MSDWSDKSGCRNFTSISEMNDTIVNNINSKVGEDDLLFHLGDWSFGGADNVNNLADRLKCNRIITLRGNHDVHIDRYSDRFLGIHQYLEVSINKHRVIMMHYPIASWNEMGRGSIMLFGHCHGNYDNSGKSMDVGVDTNGFFPYSMDEIHTYMADRKVVAKDHH